MTVQLIPIETIRTRMKLPESDQLDTLMLSSLQGTAVYLSARMETQLSAGNYTAVFWVDRESPDVKGTVQLRMPHGFIKPESVKVAYSRSLDYSKVEASPLSIMAEKGVVVLPTSLRNEGGHYIWVEYEYGFVDEDPTVPDWLAEAALVYTVQLMTLPQLTDVQQDSNPLLKLAATHTDLILMVNRRDVALMVRPIY
jgi:hypothetical protein